VDRALAAGGSGFDLVPSSRVHTYVDNTVCSRRSAGVHFCCVVALLLCWCGVESTGMCACISRQALIGLRLHACCRAFVGVWIHTSVRVNVCYTTLL
jgi:hypothetical protein